MAPFRNRDRSNRSGRGQVEHNVLEGLPINQYREVEVAIGHNSADNKQLDKDAWPPEHPMPRDSHLLPEHSQQLLRAARSGRIYKHPAPQEEDRENMEDEDEHKEVQRGFTVKKWIKVPRHLEETEPEYLAKRRKGLPSQYASTAQAPVQPAPLRETKVKKVDSEGNVSVYKALVPEGQTVEGEVQATDVALTETAPAAAAPGTVVEGVGVVNAEGVVVVNNIAGQTPPRRRPPPPKKRSKKAGPGRGKKKVVFVEGSTEQGTPASGNELLTVPGVKQENGSVEPSDGDTPMADAGDEEEGEESEDEDGEDREQSPTPAQSATPSSAPIEAATEPVQAPVHAPMHDSAKELTPPPITSATAEPPVPVESLPLATEPIAQVDLKVNTENPDRSISSSPELPLSAMAHSRQNSLNQIPTISTLDPSALISTPVTALPDALAPEVLVPEIPTEAPVVETIPEVVPEPVVPEANPEVVPEVVSESAPEAIQTDAPPELEPLPAQAPREDHVSEGEPDLLGSLEAHLDQEGSPLSAPCSMADGATASSSSSSSPADCSTPYVPPSSSSESEEE